MSSYDKLFIGGRWAPPSSTTTIEVGNSIDYGLGGSVWTADSARPVGGTPGPHRHHGHHGYLPDPAGPWGGVKSSGTGRELGPGAIAAYQNLKTVYA